MLYIVSSFTFMKKKQIARTSFGSNSVSLRFYEQSFEKIKIKTTALSIKFFVNNFEEIQYPISKRNNCEAETDEILKMRAS